MNGTKGRLAVSTSVFAVVTIVLIVIAAAGFGLYATKSATTITETTTQTTTQTSTSTAVATASISGVSEALALTITNSGSTSASPTVSMASNFPGSTVTAGSSNPNGVYILSGSQGVYDYTITGAGMAQQLIISIMNAGSLASNPDITATSSTSGAIITPASGNPTSIAAGATAFFTFTITGAASGHVNLSFSVLGSDTIGLVIEAVP